MWEEEGKEDFIFARRPTDQDREKWGLETEDDTSSEESSDESDDENEL